MMIYGRLDPSSDHILGCRDFDQTSWSRLLKQRRSRVKQPCAMPVDLEASEESALSKPKSW